MKKELKIYLASPRGFCAGVKRAIEIVEKSISKFGAPVYVRHEIVHNKQVVEELKEKGAIFVDQLSDVGDTSRPVIFSAHGVPKSVPEEAKLKNLSFVDATCPLVSSRFNNNGAIITVDPFKKNKHSDMKNFLLKKNTVSSFPKW